MSSNDPIYLNNAAQGFPLCEPALQAHSACLREVPTGARHSHGVSKVEIARREIANSLGLPSDSVFFQPSVTYGVNAVVRGLASQSLEMVVDNRAHNSVLRAAVNTPGVVLQVANLHRLDESTDFPALEACLGKNTALVALTAVSNVTGTIYDIGTIIRRIRRLRPDIAVFVDAAQAVGMTDLAPSLEADFVVFGAAKYLHSIPGAAVLIARRPLIPTVFGGTGTYSAISRVQDLPMAPLEVGTLNEPAIISMSAAWQDWLANRELYSQRHTELAERLLSGATRTPGIRILGCLAPSARIPLIAFAPERGDVEKDWIPFLESQHIFARGGLHCSPTVHEEHGLLNGGSLRLSASRFTKPTDIDMAWEAISDFTGALAELDSP